MNSVVIAVYSLWNQIVYAINNIRPFDVLDILLMAYIIFKAIGFLRETRAGQLVKGLIILFVFYLIARWWQLATMNWLLSKVFDSAIIVAAVIFQPEIRRILERVGRTNFSRGQLFDRQASDLSDCIDDVSKAITIMQEKRIGALIVFERRTQLGEIINTGTVIDAHSSVSMINNVFFPKSPLHDGALIIRDGRLYAAGCILPLTQRADLSSQLGTRHRAAIGMTENSDAVVLVVSEETGSISIVVNGSITRDYSPVSAVSELTRLLFDDETENNNGGFSKIVDKIKLTKSQSSSDRKDGKD